MSVKCVFHVFFVFFFNVIQLFFSLLFSRKQVVPWQVCYSFCHKLQIDSQFRQILREYTGVNRRIVLFGRSLELTGHTSIFDRDLLCPDVLWIYFWAAAGELVQALVWVGDVGQDLVSYFFRVPLHGNFPVSPPKCKVDWNLPWDVITVPLAKVGRD